MIYALAFNFSVNLILGLALWLVWVRVRSQSFTRLLGASFLTQIIAPPAYLLWRSSEPLLHLAGEAGLALSGTLGLVSMVAGLRALAGQPMRWRQALALGGVWLVLLAILLEQGLQSAEGASAAVNSLLGMLALRWLWRFGTAERLAGLLLILLGVNQFIFAFGGEAWLGLQASSGGTLRLLLGSALLHAALRRTSAESHRLRQQLHYLTENSHQGVAVMREGRVLYANAALLRIYGVQNHPQLEQLLRDPSRSAELREAVSQRHKAVLDGSLTHAQWEGQRQRGDGSPMQLQFSSWRVVWEGQPAEHIVISDDTERFNAANALLHQATHDPATSLPNRSALQQRLRELCAAGTPFGLVWLDLDRFTLLNDAYGHATGDAVLRAIAALLQQEFEPQAQAMHLGEDEFALLITADAAPEQLREFTRRLRAQLARPISAAGREIYIDASIGVARFPDAAQESDGMLREASAAMHEAKQDPGTSVRWAQASARRSSTSMLAEQAMRAGLKNAEFQLLYQPKVNAADGRLLSFEALVRWHRPGHGIVSPADFIPAAERTGLIVPLGAMLLEQACQQLSNWLHEGGTVVPVAVNVSPLQLQDPGFPAYVARTLQAFQVPPALLTLEMTETAAVRDAEQARERIARLKELGIMVALDDFGTGFSSLNLLRSMPLDAVKIDRSLIEPMPEPEASAVVRAICRLAAVLQLKVVAEGIETEAQAEAARQAGCNELQGWLFGRPLPAAEAGLRLRRNETAEQSS